MRDSRFDRVVLDGLNLGLRQGTGIATYAKNLARLLARAHVGVDVLYDHRVPTKAGSIEQELRFHSALSRSRGGGRPGRLLRWAVGAMQWTSIAAFGAKAVAVERDVVLLRDALPNHPDGAGILSAGDVFRQASASARLLGRPLRVRLPEGTALHLTYAIPLVAVHAPTIMTVHDVIPLRLPHAVIDPGLHFFKNLRVAAESADHIIAVSESTKEDLLRVLRLRPEKITVTYQPVRPFEGFDPKLAAEIVTRIYGLTPGEYFLFTGAIEPKKNLPRLIEAYLLSGAERPLIIAGPDAWSAEEQLAPFRRYQAREANALRAQPSPASSSEKLRRLGYLRPRHLAALLAHARALLFPSLYEGFGLPVVEAMQLGVPVLAGSLGALPEIAGGAALLVDPFDTTAIARGIRALDSDRDLLGELHARGLQNVKRFSDAACLERLATAYRAVGIVIPAQPDGES